MDKDRTFGNNGSITYFSLFWDLYINLISTQWAEDIMKELLNFITPLDYH